MSSFLQSRVMLEEKNLSSNETISRLREEISGSESRRVSLEQDLRRLNQDHTDLIRKLSVAEATLEIGNRVCSKCLLCILFLGEVHCSVFPLLLCL